MTNTAAHHHQGNNGTVIGIAVIAAIAGLLFGYDTGVISGALLFIRKSFALDALFSGLVVGGVLIGALIGSLMSCGLADKHGRRKLLLFTACIFIFGSIATAFATGKWVLILGRIVLGVAIGMGSYTAPLYIAEISPYHIRGALVTLNQLAITIGIVSSYVINYTLAGSGQWRLMLGIGAIPGIFLLIGVAMLPESPRWLFLKGHAESAKKTLARLRGSDAIDAELNAIGDTIASEQGVTRAKLASWMKPALIIGIGLSIVQQVTGINTVIYYAPSIFKIAGFESNVTAILATLGVGVVNVLATVAAMPLLDKLGRRPLLLMGLAGMTLSLGVLGYAFAHPDLAATLRWFAVSCIVFYIICFAMSLGPIAWLIVSEVFPLNVRGLGVSISTAANWAANFAVTVSFLSLVNTFGPANTFYGYALIGLLSWFFVYLIVPETKGRTLEQIEANLRAGMAPRDIGRTDALFEGVNVSK